MIAKELSLFHLIRPAVADSGAPAGIFLLHGYGSNEEDLFSFASELPEDLFVISIRAPYSLEPFGYAWYAINFEAARGKWNDTAQAIASKDALEGFIDEAIAAYGIDPDRISLLGFSQGSILSYALALSEPRRFKALVALSGYIDSSMLREGYREKDFSRLAIYASHGQLDMVIPPEWAAQSSTFLKDLGIDHRFEEFPVGHGVSPANFASFRKWLADKY